MKYLLLSLFFPILTFAEIPLPELNRTVVDPNNYISKSDRDALDQSIRNYFNKTTNQFGVIVVDTLNGESIETFAIRAFDKWKLGDAKKDNGVLFILAVKDRKTRIEVGRGLEGDLTDAETKRIQVSVRSLMKDAQYGKALLASVEATQETISKNQVREFNKNYKVVDSVSEAEKYLDKNATRKDTLKAKEVDIESIILTFTTVIFGFSILFAFINYKGLKDSKISLALLSNKNKAQTETVKQVELDTEKYKNFVSEVEEKYRNSYLATYDSLQEQLLNSNQETKTVESKINELKNLSQKYGVKL